MIRKQDILDRVAEWHLRPEVVEKDYVLGWLLAALGAHPETAAHWVFKGGTCIKKCFAETYRFSEDLDFTLRPGAIYDEEGLRGVVREVAATAGEASGISFLVNDIVVRPRQNRRGERTFEARLGYRGPLDNPAQPKVRFDLSQYEEVVLPTERRAIFHPYPDSLPSDAAAVCYAFDEVLAEKTRALIERTRPRDLYDVVLILDDHVGSLDLRRAREVLLAKCEAKGIAFPTAAGLLALVRDAAELASEWENMLGHQLPALPDLAAVIERFARLAGWVDAPTRAAPPPARLPVARAGGGPTPDLVAPRSSRFWGVGVPLDVIRFAGANRLLVAFTYNGKPRTVEPYSLRRPKTGNLLLYGWERDSSQIKAFDVSKIRDVEVTRAAFSPRYRIEFTA
jgi:predicted nucleotidyltransferase component of viral defense system